MPRIAATSGAEQTMSYQRMRNSVVLERLIRIAPGLNDLVNYRAEDLRHDFISGLCVAAIALPVGVAYAQLAGFNAVVGLYSSILPLVAYALFGTSRQLIVGPDAATCALIVAAISPLAAPGSSAYLAMSMTLALVAGLLCIGASFLRLGVCADFLSRPILTGFMNGVALSIVLGQMGKMLGFNVESSGIVPRLMEVAGRLGEIHIASLAIAIGTFAVLLISPKVLPRVPAALMALALSGLATKLFSLHTRGVETIGPVPAGLPSVSLPRIKFESLDSLFLDAAGIALIAFCSGMLTARSFAAKNGYDVDDDRELAAIGAANITSALSQGFAISGASSRTAMNDASGGRTQVAGLFAAAAVAVVLMFLTGPLQYVPIPALGAVLVIAAASLVDVATLKTLWREARGELAISIVATLGVVALGSMQGILLAVVLALLRFIRIVARPACEVLGDVKGMPGFHSADQHPTARFTPGLCLFRFNSPIVFFNARYFKRSALQVVDTPGLAPRWFVLDAVPVTTTDVTGRHTLAELRRELAARGITMVLAGRYTQTLQWLKNWDVEETGQPWPHFPTLREAVRAYRRETAARETRSRESTEAPN
jgi:high affinity sulfate transporter 1